MEQEKRKKIYQAIQYFADNWDIKLEMVDYGITKDQEGMLSIEEDGIYRKTIYQLCDRYPNILNKDEIKRDITWFSEITQIAFSIKARVEENNIYAQREMGWLKSSYMNPDNLEERYELIQQIKVPEFQESIKEQKMRIMIGDAQKSKLIDEMMKILGLNGYFVFAWIQQVIDIFQEEVNQLIKEIDKHII